MMIGLTMAVMSPLTGAKLTAEASNINDIKDKIDKRQTQIKDINEKIDTLAEAQELIEEKIDDLNAEIINTMTSIGMKEDEIAEKEQELSDKQAQIEVTEAEYEAAKDREEKQQQDMMIRTRMMYEHSQSTYLGIFLQGGGLSDMLNRMDFIEKIYKYDKTKLTEYIETKNQVHDLWDELEEEKKQLEDDKAKLETDKEALRSQESNLKTMLDKKKKESANYDAEIKKAKQEASVAKKLLQQEQNELKKLQTQQNKPNGGSSNAANGSYTNTGYKETIENASGSDLGKKVAKYACQYIGNPYVMGGTSLTNGADCSGFTFRVYKDFDYHLPRTSYEQRSAGKGVNYDDAQPGDLICYDGHVALYIGGGKIVHASSAKTGIKVGNATYRSILAVRRII